MTNRVIRNSLLGVLLFLATGCTSFEIVNPTAMDGVEVFDKPTVVTFHGSYWGFYWSETDYFPAMIDQVQDDKECQGLHKVESSSNLGYALASIFTIGLWAPSTVEYSCYVEVRDDKKTNTTLPAEGSDDGDIEQ